MKQLLTIIPEDFLTALKENQDKILNLLESKGQISKTQFITEKEAKDLFQRKSTWFWQMRKDGLLPYSKIGKSIYYSIKDLNSLLEKNKSII